MKNTFSSALLLALLLSFGMSTSLLAQSKEEQKKTTIDIKVVEKKDGKTNINERKYQLDPMSETEQRAFVDKVLDSLGVDSSGQKQVSIVVNDNQGDVWIENRNPSDRTATARSNGRQRVEIRSHNNNNDEPMIWSWRDGNNSFHFDTDELRGNLRRLEKDMKPRLEAFNRSFSEAGDRMGNFWYNDVMGASTVRTLNAYPNNPDNGVLNLRFNTPDKGDVHITVTDTQGKEVGKKTIKDFSGEFVGQIELKKNTKGTLFVTVVQNEDGMVRRVVLK